MARNDAGALTGTARSDRSRETLAPKGQSKGEACQYNAFSSQTRPESEQKKINIHDEIITAQ
jgi:hypothetical protein